MTGGANWGGCTPLTLPAVCVYPRCGAIAVLVMLEKDRDSKAPPLHLRFHGSCTHREDSKASRGLPRWFQARLADDSNVPAGGLCCHCLLFRAPTHGVTCAGAHIHPSSNAGAGPSAAYAAVLAANPTAALHGNVGVTSAEGMRKVSGPQQHLYSHFIVWFR